MFRLKGERCRIRAAALAIFLPALAAPAWAQSSNPGWFTPKSGEPAASGARRRTASRPPCGDGTRAGARARWPIPASSSSRQAQGPAQAPVLPQPPVPTINPLPKGAPPPGAVVGVISVPDIMRQSSAAQQVQKEIVGRRDKLRDDVQREQMVLRDMQQIAAGQSRPHPGPGPRQGPRAPGPREQPTRSKFQDRQRVIQEALQVALNQIERELVQVIRQVAESHGMNLVMHQEQIALNVQGFDITPQVLSQLNAVLPVGVHPGRRGRPRAAGATGHVPDQRPGSGGRAAGGDGTGTGTGAGARASACQGEVAWRSAIRASSRSPRRSRRPCSPPGWAPSCGPRADGGTIPPIRGVAALDEAQPDEASFLDNRKYVSQLAGTQAGLVVIAPAMADARPANVARPGDRGALSRLGASRDRALSVAAGAGRDPPFRGGRGRGRSFGRDRRGRRDRFGRADRRGHPDRRGGGDRRRRGDRRRLPDRQCVSISHAILGSRCHGPSRGADRPTRLRLRGGARGASSRCRSSAACWWATTPILGPTPRSTAAPPATR